MSILKLLLPLTLLLAAPAQSSVPIEKEPRHRLKLENQYVRVFDVLIPPGDTSLSHVHVNDGVGVRLSDATIRDEPEGGAAEQVSARRGAATFAHFDAPLAHRVANVGSTPFRNMFVEILPSTAAPSTGPSLAEVAGHTLVLENDRVRVVRLVLAPGQSTGMHTHALRGLGVAVSEGRLEVAVPGQAARTLEVKPGDIQWHDAGTAHSLRNAGAVPFEAVDVELR